jgi:hypothetical protein
LAGGGGTLRETAADGEEGTDASLAISSLGVVAKAWWCSGEHAVKRVRTFEDASEIRNGLATAERAEKGAIKRIRMGQVGSFYIDSKPNSPLRSALRIRKAPNGEWGAYTRWNRGIVKGINGRSAAT